MLDVVPVVSRSKQLPKLLSSLYRVDASGALHDIMLQDDVPLTDSSSDSQEKREAGDGDEDDVGEEKPIPKPDNITVTLFSWTPPSIRVGWDFDDLLPVETTESTPFPSYYPLPTTQSSTTKEPKATAKDEDRRKLEAFRIIYHPTITK